MLDFYRITIFLLGCMLSLGGCADKIMRLSDLKEINNCLLLYIEKDTSTHHSNIWIVNDCDPLIKNNQAYTSHVSNGRHGDIDGKYQFILYSNGVKKRYVGFDSNEHFTLNKALPWKKVIESKTISQVNKDRLNTLTDSIKSTGGVVTFIDDTTDNLEYSQKMNVEYIIKSNKDTSYVKRLTLEIERMKKDFKSIGFTSDNEIFFQLDNNTYAPTKLYHFDYQGERIDILLVKKNEKLDKVNAYRVEGLKRRKYSLEYYLFE